MNKKKTKNKLASKWLVLPLCAGLIASLIGPGTIGFAEELVDTFQEAILGGPSTEHVVQVPNVEPKQGIEPDHEAELFTGFRTSEEVVYQTEEITPQINETAAKTLSVDVKPKDLYQLTQEQMEELLTKGYSIHDLYQLDDLANHLLMDPMVLAERKAADNSSWEELEEAVKQEIEASQLAELTKKYPEPYKQLSKEKLMDKEKLSLLIAYDNDKGTISELIRAYKSGGEKAIVNYKSKTKAQVQSKSTAISDAPVSSDSMDPEVLEKIRAIAKETGISENELLQQFQSAKETSKQVLSGKE